MQVGGRGLLPDAYRVFETTGGSRRQTNRGSESRPMERQMTKFRTLLTTLSVLFVAALPNLAFAEGVAAEGQGWVALAAGLAIGVAAAGCGLAQGMAANGALQGIARNPSAADKIQTPMIIGLVLIESLCIYALVIAFLLQGKLG